MIENKPNHICKNIYCNKGDDGGRCHYYACDTCTKTISYRALACSPECFSAYMEQIKIARSHGDDVNLFPERTDMTHDEVVTLITTTPMSEVKEKTISELLDYDEDIKAHGLGTTIDNINKTMKRKKN